MKTRDCVKMNFGAVSFGIDKMQGIEGEGDRSLLP